MAWPNRAVAPSSIVYAIMPDEDSPAEQEMLSRLAKFKALKLATIAKAMAAVTSGTKIPMLSVVMKEENASAESTQTALPQQQHPPTPSLGPAEPSEGKGGRRVKKKPIQEAPQPVIAPQHNSTCDEMRENWEISLFGRVESFLFDALQQKGA